MAMQIELVIDRLYNKLDLYN